ncbi:MAG: hypothetical protein HOP30_11085 [Cyclobacteriaceae bacterium]|nr:hypothetical protein [Cyclobacteriaceae bacterium]
MKKASDITVTIQFFEPDEETPVSLVGATSIKFMIKLKETDADNLALVSKVPVANGTNAPLGIAITNITAAEADGLPNNKQLFSEGMAILADGSLARTKTQTFVFANNLIKALS